jgi:hypothetical protein
VRERLFSLRALGFRRPCERAALSADHTRFLPALARLCPHPLAPSASAEPAAAAPAFVEYYDPISQVRASYEERRRMVPYGGFSMSQNPYRRPNPVHLGEIFFSPRWGNGGTFGPDDGLGIQAILNSQNSLLQSQFDTKTLSGQMGVGGPGWAHFNRVGRPYGVDPYVGPFSYYSPPAAPSSVPVAGTPGGGPSPLPTVSTAAPPSVQG